MISMNAPAGAISLTQGTQSSFFINRIRKMSDLSPMDAAALTTLAQGGPWSAEEKQKLVDAVASVLAGAAASAWGWFRYPDQCRRHRGRVAAGFT